VYDELKAISDMKFRFIEEEDSCDFATRLAATMGWVEPQHLLAADYLHEHWQPDRVSGWQEAQSVRVANMHMHTPAHAGMFHVATRQCWLMACTV
jgi:secreted Zn-dependent insulinase-like peptidase